MPLEGRVRQMVEQSRETPAAHRSGEAVATKLLRIGAILSEPERLSGEPCALIAHARFCEGQDPTGERLK